MISRVSAFASIALGAVGLVPVPAVEPARGAAGTPADLKAMVEADWAARERGKGRTDHRRRDLDSLSRSPQI